MQNKMVNLQESNRSGPVPAKTRQVRIDLPLGFPSSIMDKFYFPDTPEVDNATIIGIQTYIDGINTVEPTFDAVWSRFWVVTFCAPVTGRILVNQIPFKSLCPDFVNPAGPVSAGKTMPFHLKVNLRNCYVQNTIALFPPGTGTYLLFNFLLK